MDPKFEAALIAAAVALVGSTLTFIATYWQTRQQLRSKIEELTQTQYKDIIAKRIEVYSKLWKIVQTELSDLERLEKLRNPDWRPDSQWLGRLLGKLIEWHQEYGVFLSEGSYSAFARLRHEAVELLKACNKDGRDPTLEEFESLDRIYYYGYVSEEKRKGGLEPREELELSLATCLKNDLGSYKITYLSYKDR
jgi:hypothetical protein